MISKATTKFLKSLQLKKYRRQERLFLVEGEKSVLEVLKSDFKVHQLLVTEKFMHDYAPEITPVKHDVVTEKMLASAGTFVTNNAALAVVEMKPNTPVEVSTGYTLVLDGVNDPGNLGTIIRTADWYGIRQIVASDETAEFYNPKVIAASKGSFCRVNVYYASLEKYLDEAGVPVYGAFMEGENIHEVKFAPSGILLLGNEARGISEKVMERVTCRITIPRYGAAESLNVAMATAIICDNITRFVR